MEASRALQRAALPPGAAILIFNKFQEAYAVVNSSVALNYTPLTCRSL